MTTLSKEHFDSEMGLLKEDIGELKQTVGEMKKDINFYAKVLVNHDTRLVRLEKEMPKLRLKVSNL